MRVAINDMFKSEPVSKRCKHCDIPFIAPHRIVNLCSEACKQDITSAESEKHALSRYLHCQIGFPKVHRLANLSDFDKGRINGVRPLTLTSSQGKVYNARNCAESYLQSDYWGMILSSPLSGLGKSRLGVVVLAELARKGVLPSANLEGNGYFKAEEIAKVLESERFDSKKKLTTALQMSNVIMIDELGFENDRQAQEISALIQIREENQLRTIITTNLDGSHILEKYGQKLHSRIGKALLSCDGQNWRAL